MNWSYFKNIGFLFLILSLSFQITGCNNDVSEELSNVVETDSGQEQEYRTGMNREDYKKFSKKVGVYKTRRPRAAEDYPEIYNGLLASMPPVGNQRSQGSCVGWATAYALKTMQEGVEESWSLNSALHQFSPAWIYNQINGGVDDGSQIPHALELIVNQGAEVQTYFPYNYRDYLTLPSMDSHVRAGRYKALSWQYVDRSVESVKDILLEGQGAILGMDVYDDLTNLNRDNPIYDEISGESDGSHAVVIVGYDDSKNAFQFINSWGNYWGTWKDETDESLGRGYGWISYDFFQDSEDPIGIRLYRLFDATNEDSVVVSRITNPTTNILTIGTEDITVEATSTEADIDRIEFYIDNTHMATVTEAEADGQYLYSWDTSAVVDKYYEVEAIAYDTAGNSMKALRVMHARVGACSGNFAITTQEELEEISACTSIKGDLLIENSSIENLDPLSGLTSVGGRLLISNNESLVDLSGLSDLVHIGGWLGVSQNLNLTAIDGFNNLIAVAGISIYQNYQLQHINGFMNISTIKDDINITRNENLISVTGFHNLTDIGRDLSFSENPNISILEGFTNLQSIGEELKIYQTSLTHIDNFNALTHVGERIWLYYNTELSSVSGLSNLEYVERIEVRDNDALSSLSGITGKMSELYMLYIWGNQNLNDFSDIEGKNFTHFGLTNTYLSNLDLIEGIGAIQTLWVIQNPLLESIDALTQIPHIENLYFHNNPMLQNVDGLINYTSVNQLEFAVCDSLTDISGLSNLETASGLLLYSSPITSLLELRNLREVNSLRLHDLAISNLEGLTNLTYLGDFLISENSVLTGLHGMDSLTSIEGNLRIERNPELTNFAGLENITYLNRLGVFSNPKLESFNGLQNLTSIGYSLNVASNNVLKDFSALNQLQSIGGFLSIINNPELLFLGMENLESINQETGGGSINISSNPKLFDYLAWDLRNQLTDFEQTPYIDNRDDAEAPIVFITSPEGGVEIEDSITISADVYGLVTKLEYYLIDPDGVEILLGEGDSEPYSITTDVSSLASNDYQVIVRATNEVGIIGESEAIDVTIENTKKLLSYFPLNGTTDNVAPDATDCRLMGNPTWVDGAGGQLANALFLDGEGDYVMCDSSSDLNVPTQTISLWFNLDEDSKGVLFNRGTWNKDGWQIRVSGNKLYFYHYATDYTDVVKISDTLNENQWYMVSVVIDNSIGEFGGYKVYLNGIHQEQFDHEMTVAMEQTDDRLMHIGAKNVWGDFYSGGLDDIRIYNYDLTDDEIASLYQIKDQQNIPNTPTDLQVEDVTEGQVTLSWQDNADNEVGFYLERSSTEEFDSTNVEILVADTQAYTDQNVTPGAIYYYRIRPFDAVGAYNYSEVLRVRVRGYDDALVAYYDFNMSLIDHSDTANDGIMIGEPEWVGSLDGLDAAISFDGIDDYINCPGTPALNNEIQTISLWTRLHNQDTHGKVMARGAWNSDGWQLEMNANKLSLYYYSEGQKGYVTLADDFDINRWYHIVIIIDTTDDVHGTVKAYIDGEYQFDTRHKMTNDMQQLDTRELNIGTRSEWGGFFDGDIDDVKIYNYPLHISEIEELNQTY